MKVEEVILFQIEKTSRLSKLYSQREFDRLKMDLTVEQWILLKIIDENDGLTQKELADRSLRDPASITRTLDLLEKKKLIKRREVPDNRRQYSIVLTKNGSSFIKEHLPVVRSHRKNSIKGLDKKELKLLARVLEKMQLNMQ